MDIMDTRKIIKDKRKELSLSLQQLADLVGVSKTTIMRWENGDIANMGRDKIQKLATALSISPTLLMGWDVRYNSLDAETVPEIPGSIALSGLTVEYPILSEIRTGYGGDPVEIDSGENISLPKEFVKGNPNNYFVIRAKGDSMYPKIVDGDYILVRRQDSVDSGSTAVILYNDREASIKRVNYISGENWIELEPFNRLYPPIKLSGQDLKQCRVLGQVKKLIRDF